jgi:hypothetical protein
MVRHTPVLLEIVARALGARYPAIVAQRIAPDCPDVPAAIAALRERMPHWFEPVAPAGSARAAA